MVKPRTLIAVQFALWAFFFAGIIPFSGDFLLPIVWLYDKRVFFAFVVAQLIWIARGLPGVISALPSSLLIGMPSWMLILLTPLMLSIMGVSMVFTTWIAAWWLRRKMRRLAPDLIHVQ